MAVHSWSRLSHSLRCPNADLTGPGVKNAKSPVEGPWTGKYFESAAGGSRFGAVGDFLQHDLDGLGGSVPGCAQFGID